MNQRETKEELDIPHFTYSDYFLAAVRDLENSIRNFERAYERLTGGKKTYRRASPERPGASPEGGAEETKEP